MRFVRFESKGMGYTPKITISKSGHINLNAGACRRFSLDKFACIVLYFDPETQEIGLQFGNEDSAPGARALQHRGTSAGVYARAFLDYHEIDRTVRHVHDPREGDEMEDFLIIGPVAMLRGNGDATAADSGATRESEIDAADAT